MGVHGVLRVRGCRVHAGCCELRCSVMGEVKNAQVRVLRKCKVESKVRRVRGGLPHYSAGSKSNNQQWEVSGW